MTTITAVTETTAAMIATANMMAAMVPAIFSENGRQILRNLLLVPFSYFIPA